MICENDKNDPVREAECFYLKPIFDWEGGGGGGDSLWLTLFEKGDDNFMRLIYLILLAPGTLLKVHLTLNFYLKLGLVCAKKYY